MRTEIQFTLVAGALLSSLLSAPAHAQRARTFVASYGQDSNPCSFMQPCRNFQAAYANTAAGGEVTAIDSAGFGPLVIQKSITITSPTGVEAGIVPSSGADAIDVAAGPNDVVVLRGLTLEGGGGLNGQEGIFLNAGGTLEVLDCVIKDFQNGVLVQPASGTTTVMIKNTTVLNNANTGIYITPRPPAKVLASLNHVTADLNNYGIYIDAAPLGLITATINDSHVTNNLNGGITLNASSAPNALAVTAEITGTTVTGNGGAVFFAADLVLNNYVILTLSRNRIGVITGTTGGLIEITSDGSNFIDFTTYAMSNVARK